MTRPTQSVAHEKCVFTAEDAERAEDSKMELNDVTGQIVDAGIKVHSALGPGLLESAYEACLAYELRKRGFLVSVQQPLPVRYDNVNIDAGYKLDLLVNDMVVVELKAIGRLQPIHDAQLLSYLKLGDYRVGLLMNFHVLQMRDGIRRLVNNF